MVLVVSDLEATLAYYEDALGFEVGFRYGDPLYFAGVCRGNVTIHLQAASSTERPAGATLLNVFVGSADAIYEDLRRRGARIRSEPATYPYGMREVAVEDLDGNVLVFGNPAEPPPG